MTTKFFQGEKVIPLTSQETFALIFEQSKFRSIGFPARTIDWIWELTAGYPAYIQRLYNEIIEYALKEGLSDVEPDTVDKVLPDILEKSAPDFTSLTACLSPPACAVMAAGAAAYRQQQPFTPETISDILALNRQPLDPNNLAEALNELQEQAILRPEEWGGFRFEVPLMALWLFEQQPLQTLGSPVPNRLSQHRPLETKWLFLVGSGLMILALGLVGWYRLNSYSAPATATLAVVAVAPPGDTPTVSPTATARPVSTTTSTTVPARTMAEPAGVFPPATPLPTFTPVETATPTATPMPTLTSTSTVAATAALPPSPTVTPLPITPTATTPPATPTPSLPRGEFALLNPVALDQPSYGLTEFEWQWTGPIPADAGFEVRVWREGEPQMGVHDAVFDNQNGVIESLGENKYRLRVDITGTAGVQGYRGEYWWTVALVQINPSYADLGLQAPPVLMRFEPKDGGGGGGGDSGNGGGSSVGVD